MRITDMRQSARSALAGRHFPLPVLAVAVRSEQEMSAVGAANVSDELSPRSRRLPLDRPDQHLAPLGPTAWRGPERLPAVRAELADGPAVGTEAAPLLLGSGQGGLAGVLNDAAVGGEESVSGGGYRPAPLGSRGGICPVW